MITIIKRNGQKVPFDAQKIENAINKAFLEVDGQLYETDTAHDIAEAIYIEAQFKPFTVEEIQDAVEDYLMRSERRDVARAYIRFRYKKEVARTKSLDFKKAIISKLLAKNVQNQNANVDEASFGGRTGEAASLVSKQLALDEFVSPMARVNHEDNIIYIHDLDSYVIGSHNCLTVPFDALLAKGFRTRQTTVRAAQSIDTAFQLIAVIFQLQSLNQFGGVASGHFDWTMVPYVRKSFLKHYKDGLKYIESAKTGYEIKIAIDRDEAENFSITDTNIYNCKGAYEYATDMTIRETQKAADSLLHNLNTLQSRSGNQLPFTSLNYGTCTLPEGRMVTKAILDSTLKGIGTLYTTPIFPCSIFQCMRGINLEEGEPNYDLFQLALKCTAKRLYPNYANVDWSGNAGYDVNDPKTYFATMGKRKLQLM